VSFEPLSSAFAALCAAATNDRAWECVNLALGNHDGTALIGVSRDLVSSSLLPVTNGYTRSIPGGTSVEQQRVRTARLDSIASGYWSRDDCIHLKLDVQGYEKEVLLGANLTLAQVVSLEVEMSLVELYRGQPLLDDMVGMLQGFGYALVWIQPLYIDPSSGYLWQVEGLFARRSETPLHPEGPA
jgi:FkbM family methyltransferase